MLLKDKVAIVTGGGKGIGKAITKAMIAEGAAVAIAGRALAALEETAKEFGPDCSRVLPVQTDVSSEKQVSQMVEQTVKAFGQVDILVNNSGISGPTALLMDLKLEDWNEVLAIDLTGAMLCSREVLRHMVGRNAGGSIIMIGAEGGRAGDGRSGHPRRAPYCCAKMGLIGLTETLSQEVGKYNIRVNCISAAAVRGERWLRVVKARAEALGVPYEEELKKATMNYSLGRPAEEDEVASCAVFLSSKMASGVTGQTLVCHCGQHV